MSVDHLTEAELMSAFEEGEPGNRQSVIDEIVARDLTGMVHILFPLLYRDDLRAAARACGSSA